jgi:hypothetical protein
MPKIEIFKQVPVDKTTDFDGKMGLYLSYDNLL